MDKMSGNRNAKIWLLVCWFIVRLKAFRINYGPHLHIKELYKPVSRHDLNEKDFSAIVVMVAKMFLSLLLHESKRCESCIH